MSVAAIPAPAFEIVGGRPDHAAGVPTFELLVEASEPGGRHVYTIALHTLVNIEAPRRAHDLDTKQRLVDLFGPPERWATTTGSMPWVRVDMLVPSFTGRTTFALPVPCGYDLEVAATRYCGGLRDGVIPLDLHFNGTVFHRDDDGRLQIAMVPWAATARFDLPYDVWRETIDRHYPNGGWLALHETTIERLTAYRARHALTSFDAAVARLLEADEEDA
jgi:hypothetical protein